MATNPERMKCLGAYYTNAEVARFLVRWAVREQGDLVLDPSFGDGVFLHAAAERVRSLGGAAALQIWGVEINLEAHRRAAAELSAGFSLPAGNLVGADFFSVRPGGVPMVDAVVGNPPFIRYQRFTGAARAGALRACAEAGVRVSELASSWVPFLIHGIRMLREGGRLAMVVPAEIGQAATTEECQPVNARFDPARRAAAPLRPPLHESIAP